MWEAIRIFFTAASFLELLLIFVAKVVEVSISTLRIILVNKGYRAKATMLSFVEILLWVFIASTVINGISEAPIKGIIYGIGFSLGVYFGSIVENKLAFGQVLVQVIVDENKGILLTNALRSNGHGVTVIDAYGRDSDKSILLVFANRKNRHKIVELVESIDEEAMIVANDVNSLRGGFVKVANRKLWK